METNALIDLVHEAQGQLWVDKVNETHRTGRLCPWVSTFHPRQLSCQLDGTFHHGAFNAGVKMVFSDSAANRLGLGPFIMMDFIDGVSASDVLKDPHAEQPTRLMRDDISDRELFGSAPWWLLQDRPVNCAWDCKGDEPPKIAARYFRYLEIFIRVLEEEEAKLPGQSERELSSLVKWSQASGAMWLHMLLSSGFNDHHSFPFTMLRRHLGTAEWARREKAFENADELDAFAARKVGEMEKYEEALEKREKELALVDSGKLTREEFVAHALTEPGWPLGPSSFRINDEGRDDEASGLPQMLASSSVHAD
ncbi:Aminoglycoside 3'-phosphotransferase and Choline Kinase family protein [Diplocarpon rosae]|nr:Aminoglycoside 3'-phosphotransferase and Choline Kinase family protein [Diplocarpon rosae]